MSKPQVRIYQDNGDFIDRQMNDDEFAQWQKDNAEAKARKDAEIEAAAKKAAAEAKLAALGLTADDFRALGL